MIVAVLAMLAGSMSGSIRKKADVTRCQNNLRQIAAGASAYTAERNGVLPDRGSWDTPRSAWSILPYLGDSDGSGPREVLVCPAIARSTYRPVEKDYRSYSINQYATGSDNSSANARETWQSQVASRNAPQRISNVKQPSAQAFFMDGTFLEDSYGARFSAFMDSSRLTARDGRDESGAKTPFIHENAIVVVFLDGHLETITRSRAEAELIGPANPASSQSATSPRRHPFWGAEK